jgi:hypothetical protein
MAMFMNQISNEEKRSKEMVRMRSVLVMVLVLALWLLARSAGSDGLQEKVTKRRSKRVSVGEGEGA